MSYSKSSSFPRTDLSDDIRIWERAAISLSDIRHNLISPEEALQGYRLPANSFIFANGGKADVLLDDTPYSMDRFGLFHAGKGTELSIQPRCDWLEYYLVLYKAGEPAFHRREYAKLLEQTNPFRRHYGFAPDNPLFFAEQLRKMYECWKGPSPFNLFYGKTAFYQLVLEVYNELVQTNVHCFEPDSVAMVKRYLDEHYGDEISMQELCGILGISYSHFYKSFKERTGISPQEYLISVRLTAARHWLQDSDMPMRAIADCTGFANERNFYRTFAKHYGISPNTFRQNASPARNDHAIGSAPPFPYNWESQVRLDELKEKGALSMFKQMRSKTILAAALSLMLLMSACSTAPTNSNGADPSSSTVTTQTEAEASEPMEDGTRTVSTVMGDIEVPLNPKRVVVNWYVGDVLSAGLNVVGYNAWAHETMPFYSQMTATKKIENWEPEDVMTLEPDLIITYKVDDFEKFGKIAPVLVIEEKVPSPERAKIIGEATGHSETANKNIEAFESKLAAAKEVFQAKAFEGKTFSIMQDWGATGEWSGVAYETGSRGGTLVYKYLGLKYPDKLAELLEERGSEGRSNTLSYEVAHEYFGDYILWFQQEGKESEYAQTDIWKSIPAVAEGRVLEIPGEYMGLFFFSDVLSLTAQLDYLVDAINTLVA